MATVRVNRWDAEAGLLPMFCIYCGAPAVNHVRVEFQWHPRWAYWFLPLVLLVALNTLLTHIWLLCFHDKAAQWMQVRFSSCLLPVCGRHRLLGEVRKLAFVGCLFTLPFLGVFCSASLDLGGAELVLATCALWTPWLALAVWVHQSELRATEIGHRTITLAGVCEEFAGLVSPADEAGMNTAP